MKSDFSVEMYFIFGSIIGGLPSNSTKEDTKDCSSRCDEPYLDESFSRVLNHGAVHCARCLISREHLYLHTIGLFVLVHTRVIDYICTYIISLYPSLIYVYIHVL